jgi:hypothetical protein
LSDILAGHRNLNFRSWRFGLALAKVDIYLSLLMADCSVIDGGPVPSSALARSVGVAPRRVGGLANTLRTHLNGGAMVCASTNALLVDPANEDRMRKSTTTYLREREAAAYLKRAWGHGAPSTLRTLRCRQKGPRFHRVGSRLIVYTREDLDRWAQSLLRSAPLSAIPARSVSRRCLRGALRQRFETHSSGRVSDSITYSRPSAAGRQAKPARASRSRRARVANRCQALPARPFPATLSNRDPASFHAPRPAIKA